MDGCKISALLNADFGSVYQIEWVFPHPLSRQMDVRLSSGTSQAFRGFRNRSTRRMGGLWMSSLIRSERATAAGPASKWSASNVLVFFLISRPNRSHGKWTSFKASMGVSDRISRRFKRKYTGAKGGSTVEIISRIAFDLAFDSRIFFFRNSW